MKKARVVVIVQARMGATRLPGKPLKTVLNRPLLSYQIERLRQAKAPDEIVIATTTAPQDQVIVDLCEKEGVAVFRGSEQNVLERYYLAAKKYKADVVVRVTGDCPLSDPAILDQAIDYYLQHYPAYDYVTNMYSKQLSYPRGVDVEVFSFKGLEKAAREAIKPEEREHVTPYFYEHPEMFQVGILTHHPNEAHHRWTVDTPEDFELITRILSELYPKNPTFKMADVLELLSRHPDWVEINRHIKQKPIN